MSSEYSITAWRAARFALIPGNAERLYSQAKAAGCKEYQHLSTGIILSRYSMIAGIGLGVFSALQTTNVWPLALSAGITLAGASQLFRYTKLFMTHVDKTN